MNSTGFKLRSIIVCFTIILLNQSLSGQTWQWAISGGGSSIDVGQKTCTDSLGNVYVAGEFNGPSIIIGSVTLSNVGISGKDIFVAKYNSAGIFQWATSFGGTGDESVGGICSGTAGNIYLSGDFTSSNLNVLPYSSTNTGFNTRDVFLTSLSSFNGMALWLKTFGSAGDDYGRGCAFTNSLSSVYVTGSFMDANLVIGSSFLSNSTAGGGQADIFIASYSSNGLFNWAKSTGGGLSNEWASEVEVDASGAPHIGGTYSPNFIVGNTVIGTTTLTSNGYQDIFLAKYSNTGSFVWANGIGSFGWGDNFGGMGIDATGNVYINGSYEGAFSIGTMSLSYSGNSDAFVAKLNSAGSVQWVNQIAGPSAKYGNDLAIDANSNVYVTGTYSGTLITAGTYTLNNTTPGVSTDLYLMKYNSSGLITWATNAIGAGYESGNSITSDVVGNVYATGYINGGTAFGTNTVYSSGSNDMFLAKIGCLSTFITGTGTNVCSGSSATISAIGATSFTWNTGAISSSIVITPTINGVYTATAISPGCVGTSASYSINVLPANLSAGSPVNLFCKQKTVATASCNPSATSITWSPSVNLSSTSILNPTITGGTNTQYTITATLNNGCVRSSTLNVSVNVPTPNICLVTVDSLGNNNEIYWDKTLYPQADSFFVYREVSTNVYKRIGGVSYSSYSMYTDTNRSIGPANGNPNLTFYKYKLQAKDSCGNLSALSLWHETIFIQDQLNGNFNWNMYSIESSPSPVSNYNLKRRDLTTGTETLVAVTVGGLATDPLYNTFWPTNVKWFVDAIGFSCAPSLIQNPKGGNNQVMLVKTKTKSNQSNDKTFGTNVNEAVQVIIAEIYPNPAADQLNIKLVGISKQNIEIEMRNSLGQLIYQKKTSEELNSIPTSAISNGIYTLSGRQNGNYIFIKKIIINNN